VSLLRSRRISTVVRGPGGARSVLAHISGTAGNSGQLLCGVTTRTKGLPGNIGMVLNHAPAGQLLVRIQDAKNGSVSVSRRW
jgi:hypothetical protein